MNDSGISINGIESAQILYPPKFQAAEGKDMASDISRSLMSLVVYLGLGFLFFRRWDMLLVITAIVLLHEMGHFLAMKYYHYSDTSIFFIPLLGAFVSGSKREVSQRQNAVILLAGPLPGIVFGIILFFIDQYYSGIFIGNISLQYVVLLLVWLNVINLLPVYPLDGGQLLNRIYLDEEGWGSNLFIFLSASVMILMAVYTKFYFLLIFPAMLVFRYVSTLRHINLEKMVQEQGIDLDTSYEELRDENYWKIRSVIVTHLSAFQNVKAGPPFEYDVQEEKIMHEVENVLQRNLLQDVSVFEKIMIAVVWIGAVASPLFFDIGTRLVMYLFSVKYHL
jgi:stage IV sporulation protein FB